jgi:hypothetical protein
MATQGGLGAGLIIQSRKRLRSVKPRNEVGMSEKCRKTEFEVRDAVHRLGAQALQAALDERKKGATRGRA